MKTYAFSVILLKTMVVFLLLAFGVISAQEDSTYYNIEVVKITKITSKEKNKEKLSTKQSDLLNHDAGKFLNSLPEINSIRKAGNYASDPVLRGFKYEQLNVVIDGAANAVNACPSRMDPAVSQVNMNVVQEAEIYKGPYHFRHGAALGGTINFITIKPEFSENPRFDGRISNGYETNGNVVRNEVLAGIVSKKINWNVFGSYQNGERYKDGNGNEVRSAFKRYNVGTKMNYQWNENNITTIQINNNQGRDVEFAALNMDLIYDKTWMFQAKHMAEFNSEILKHFDFNSYLSTVDHSMGTPDRKMVSDVKSKSIGGRGEFKLRLGKSTYFTGIDFKRDEAENIQMIMPPMMKPRDGSSWQDSFVENYGWFNEFQLPLKSSKLTLSYRLDYNRSDAAEPSQLFITEYGTMKDDQVNHSASLGFSQQLTKQLQAGLWLGRGQRSGSITERFINRFAVGTDAYELVGNPQIKPETNNQADLIFTYRRENVYFQTDFFYSYLQDYISAMKVDIKPYAMSAPGTRQFQNLEKAFKTGAEARFNWKFLPNFRTEMAAAYTYAEDLNTKYPLPEIAPLDFRWNVEGDFTPVIFGLNFRHAAKQNRINPDFGEFATPDYSVFDFTSRYSLFDSAMLSFDVLNIFDRAYSEHLNRTLSNDKSQRILAPGRNFVVGFSYKF